MASTLGFDSQVRDLKAEEADLLLSKHRDYGPKNVANAPGGAINGLAVRLHDKVARLAHLLDTGADPEHEALADTALDIANYGTILSLVIRGLWPGTAENQPQLDLGDVWKDPSPTSDMLAWIEALDPYGWHSAADDPAPLSFEEEGPLKPAPHLVVRRAIHDAERRELGWHGIANQVVQDLQAAGLLG